MWQRIQTLYLAVATALTASLFFCNFVTIIGSDGESLSVKYNENTAYLCLLAVAVAVNVFTIFCFRKRVLQIRLCNAVALLMLGLQALLLIHYIPEREALVLSFTACFPAVAAILNFIASRKIFMDEVMVRASSNSLRKRR